MKVHRLDYALIIEHDIIPFGIDALLVFNKESFSTGGRFTKLIGRNWKPMTKNEYIVRRKWIKDRNIKHSEWLRKGE